MYGHVNGLEAKPPIVAISLKIKSEMKKRDREG